MTDKRETPRTDAARKIKAADANAGAIAFDLLAETLELELQARDALIRELVEALEYWVPAYPYNGDEVETEAHVKLLRKARELMNG